jgi:hypothetical protein
VGAYSRWYKAFSLKAGSTHCNQEDFGDSQGSDVPAGRVLAEQGVRIGVAGCTRRHEAACDSSYGVQRARQLGD